MSNWRNIAIALIDRAALAKFRMAGKYFSKRYAEAEQKERPHP